MTGATGGNIRATSTGKFSGDKIPSGYKGGRIQQMDDRQIELMNQLYPYLSQDSYLSRLAAGDESLFKEMEAPAMRQFASSLGNAAARFSGMGMGARRSSSFQNALGQAGSDFAQDLQSKRQALSRQALRDLFEMSHQLMGERPYKRFLSEKPEKKSPWGSIVGTGLGAAGGFFAGGPAGAFTGAKAGYDIGSQF